MSKKKQKNMSTHRLTSQWEPVDIPLSGLTEDDQKNWVWKVKCLGLKGAGGSIKSPVLEKLKEWQANDEKEYEKLLRAIHYGGTNQVHMNQDLIRQDEDKRGGYEFKNTSCKCRLFFFYDRKDQQMIICTNAYWKNKNSNKEAKEQDHEFEKCARFKELYTGKG